ncbi:MAG: histidine kinase [Burkholderiaceae bacterium]
METAEAKDESIKQAPSNSDTEDERSEGDVARQRRLPDALSMGGPVPDWCNLGVVLRVMLGVNALFCGIAGGEATSWEGWLELYTGAAATVEPVLIASLALGCLVRRLTADRGERIQVLIAILVPAILTALLQTLLGPLVVHDESLILRNCVTAAFLAAAVLYWFHMRNQSNLPALAEARLAALQARIRPHFLFNSLNAALGLIRTEPRRAESVLEDMAELFRVLMRDRRDRVTLSEEISICQQYLSIEALRLGDRLRFEISVAPSTEATLVPLLLLQPLVENAVHHGIEPSMEPGTIDLIVTRNGAYVEILVSNPWRPEPSSRMGNRMGLENVRQRLTLLHDLEARLETAVRAGRFEVRVRLPYVESR